MVPTKQGESPQQKANMNTQHTQGPWHYNESSGWVTTEARAWGTQVTGMFYGEKSERVPNGHLIAAAPDLLAACEVLAKTAQLPTKKGVKAAINLALIAIAKARGGAQ